MIGFESIAVFLLATVGSQLEIYQHRISPLVDGWGAYFPQLYFVFGRNKFDKQFLDQQCRLIDSSANEMKQDVHSINHVNSDRTVPSQRQLLARYAQTPLKHDMMTYECTTDAGNSFYGLFAANCTGEYYGIGPTCRCQEAMRYFSFSSPPSLNMSTAEWFIFMDDDLYVQPFLLLALLSRFHAQEDAVALVAGLPGEFRRMKSSPECFRQFSMAMPGILSRKSITRLAPSIHANGLTIAQAHWRGTHDVLFGFLLWLYDINVMPMVPAGGFTGIKLKENIANQTDVKTNRLFERLKGNIMFHGVG